MDLEWYPKNDKIHLFKTCNGKQLTPGGVPPSVQPNWENTHLDKVKETVKKVECFFNTTHTEWWKNMLENPPVRNETDWGWPLENWEDLEDNCNQPRDNLTSNGVTPLTHAMRKERELRQVYSGKRTTTKETIMSKSSQQQDSVVGHFIVFNHKGERRFGEVKTMTDSQLTVNLFRLISDRLIRVTSRFNHPVEVNVERESIFENLVFALPASKRIPNRIKIALASM